MAIIYFVRNGRGEQKTDSGRSVPLVQIAGILDEYEVSFSAAPPVFDEHYPINPVSDFAHVVVQVEANEVNDKLCSKGYWHIKGLRPSDLLTKLG